MTIVVVGRDLGSAKPLEEIARQLAEKGQAVAKILGETRLDKADLHGAKMVLCGMSSAEDLSEDELAAANWAICQSPPVRLFLFADVEASVGRPWFAPVRQGTTGIFVENERAARKARELFPATTQIIITGNYALSNLFSLGVTTEEVRRNLAITDDEAMILIPGGKDLTVNVLHFRGVIEGIEKSGISSVAVISIHPSDKNPPENYNHLVKKKVRAEFVLKERFTGDQLVAGVKTRGVVVPSASTVGRTAACQRVPVVNYFTDQALDRIEKYSGSRTWPEVEKGTELQVVNDTDELARVISLLLSGEINLAPAQEATYPFAEQGVTNFIVNELMRFVK